MPLPHPHLSTEGKYKVCMQAVGIKLWVESLLNRTDTTASKLQQLDGEFQGEEELNKGK